MREIKFRAWDTLRHKMYWFGNFSIGTDSPSTEMRASMYDPSKPLTGDNYLSDYDADDWDGAKTIFMQYTGLKDKNGLEIYEGDVVLGYFNVEDVSDWKWLQLTEDDARSGTIKLEVPELMEFARMPLPSEVEVIGNVFEHPELLEHKQ